MSSARPFAEALEEALTGGDGKERIVQDPAAPVQRKCFTCPGRHFLTSWWVEGSPGKQAL